LKKQNESISLLAKENNSLKRKYLEMKEEINRLEMERKVILTDKLRCEVNWHKEIQEKEQIKKELDYLREMAKNGQIFNYTERSKTNSFHDEGQTLQKPSDNREGSRSPNRTFYI
jgi:predicted RNase H-like nuclease (RuvC/YqgF family)